MRKSFSKFYFFYSWVHLSAGKQRPSATLNGAKEHREEKGPASAQFTCNCSFYEINYCAYFVFFMNKCVNILTLFCLQECVCVCGYEGCPYKGSTGDIQELTPSLTFTTKCPPSYCQRILFKWQRLIHGNSHIWCLYGTHSCTWQMAGNLL